MIAEKVVTTELLTTNEFKSGTKAIIMNGE